MPILSHIERRAMEEGRQQGLQIARREMILEDLNERFNPLPPEVIDRINQISDSETLKQLLKRGKSSGSLAEFEEVLASIMTNN
ncbi:hypothetical protein [Laspinema palackyanum]|uniref:hypothetical protein n=1 Tax=Laspinema palackyanum TaxID=3231601 RepID=UPI00345C940F|nr:DUF4351 domain-containing protein [Laspinema sp. D2c]